MISLTRILYDNKNLPTVSGFQTKSVRDTMNRAKGQLHKPVDSEKHKDYNNPNNQKKVKKEKEEDAGAIQNDTYRV